MRILFQNYSNNLSTEPQYLHLALREAGAESHIWGPDQGSVYDVFDTVKPDVFVAHYATLSNDVFSYLNEHRNVGLVLNVTGLENDDSILNSVCDKIKLSNINCKFLFSNNVFCTKTSHNDLPIKTLYPAADIFNASSPQEPSLDLAVISDKFSELVENHVGKKDVYHLLYIGGEKEYGDFDIRVSLSALSQLYKGYRHFDIIGEDLFNTQLFFDACLNCNSLSFPTSDENGEQFSKFLEKVFDCDTSDDGNDIFYQIKNQIKSKHTPFHRAWTLAKHLKNEEWMKSLDTIKGKVSTALGDL